MTKGLLGIEELSRSEIESILDRAKFFQPPQGESFRRFDTLRGRMVVNLFYEASTRTRVSFEIAAKRLGADAVSADRGRQKFKRIGAACQSAA